MLQNDNRGKHIAPIEDSFGAGFRPVSTSSVTHDGFPNGFDLLNSDGLRRVKKKEKQTPENPDYGVCCFVCFDCVRGHRSCSLGEFA